MPRCSQGRDKASFDASLLMRLIRTGMNERMWTNFNLNKFRPKSTSIKHLEKFILCLTNCSPLCNRGQPCMPEIPHVNAANNSKYIHMAIYFPTSLLKKHKTDKWLYLIGFIWARRGALKVKQDKVRVKSRAFRIKSRKWHTGQRWAPVWSTNEDRMTKHQQNLRKQIAYFFSGFLLFYLRWWSLYLEKVLSDLWLSLSFWRKITLCGTAGMATGGGGDDHGTLFEW